MGRDDHHRMIIFDDGRGHLGPMTDLRASFEVRTGMYTSAGRLLAARPRTLAGYWTPEPLRALVAARANAPVNELPNEEVLFLANGRWARPDHRVELNAGEAWIEKTTGDVIAALLRRSDAEYFLTTGQLPERAVMREDDHRLLFAHPWDVLTGLRERLTWDIMSVNMPEALVTADHATVVGPHPVQVHPSARIGAHVVFDATDGPILIEDGVTIRHHAILCGPVSIGRGASVLDKAFIKSGTSIGRQCKVAGEIGGTIFQGFANKGHDGHLGDSWIGKWANLGAGTMNSNLLNTYGDVMVKTEVNGPRRRSGRVFCGAFVGDHVKTAIGTRIMTGTVIGTGSMIASSTPPPTTVGRFAWLTDAGTRNYRWDKFLEVMETVMKRRSKTPSPEYIQALSATYKRTFPLDGDDA